MKNGHYILDDGSEEWYVNDLLHRTDGPAAIFTRDNISYWYFMGQIHRVGGPAIIFTNSVEWWQYNNRHRIGGPAIEYNNGDKIWVVDGRLHRTDGPAIEKSDQIKWYINGIDISADVEQWIKENNISHYSKWDNQIKMQFKLIFG